MSNEFCIIAYINLTNMDFSIFQSDKTHFSLYLLFSFPLKFISAVNISSSSQYLCNVR